MFSEDASYLMEPFEQPTRGIDAIRGLWERERQNADEAFTMSYEILAVEGDTGVARVDVSYEREPPLRFLDIWIARFNADGRCREFEEWPFEGPPA